MNYVLQNIASEDMIQLFEVTPVGTPKTGVLYTDVTVMIRKSTSPAFVVKTLTALDWVDRGGGNYSIQFSSSEFDTLGLFRYRVMPVVMNFFASYEDSVIVTEEIPIFPQTDPPLINDQSETPPGLTPNPVQQGTILTINGTDLGGALEVKIGSVVVPIVANTDSQIQVTVTAPNPPTTDGVPLGFWPVTVTTPGGVITTTQLVEVILNIAAIPGSGVCGIWGIIFDTQTIRPKQGVTVIGRILDMPNVGLGVGWTDESKFATTDANGYFELEMPRGFKIDFSIPETNYRRILIVPNAQKANYISEIQ